MSQGDQTVLAHNLQVFKNVMSANINSRLRQFEEELPRIKTPKIRHNIACLRGALAALTEPQPPERGSDDYLTLDERLDLKK